ncbi:hypothetical protein [Nocardia inohanensis]|uniref:hypothetical protein n=1 Tax=Nocardia inohanensis TaxID=209246 RepID=UPI0012FAA46D|nr:hypothetical protein [Nocardia inohanensis]
MERLRRKLEGMKAAEAGPRAGEDDSKVIRLPRRPRRATEEGGEPPRRPWFPEGGSIYDPAPTRPVTRSELQRETGWWPADQGAVPPPPPEGARGEAEHDGSVIDLGALRRKRAGEDAPATGRRRMAKPRRIGPTAGGDTEAGNPEDDNPGPAPRR